MLDARQLGLKLIANVTYGYTAASYSGRMPCVEVGKEGRVRGRGGGRKKEFFFLCLPVCLLQIADSIVGKGRETLERAIRLVNSTPEWRAKVVYGDTDR